MKTKDSALPRDERALSACLAGGLRAGCHTRGHQRPGRYSSPRCHQRARRHSGPGGHLRRRGR